MPALHIFAEYSTSGKENTIQISTLVSNVDLENFFPRHEGGFAYLKKIEHIVSIAIGQYLFSTDLVIPENINELKSKGFEKLKVILSDESGNSNKITLIP